MAYAEQADAMEADDRQGMVERYLELPLPDNWDDMDLYSRREYVTDPDALTAPKGRRLRKTVSNAEIWCECMRRDMADLRPADSYAIAAIMAKVDGWSKCGKSRHLPIYGRQRLYARKE